MFALTVHNIDLFSVIHMSMRINQAFDTSLTDETDTKYKFYVEKMELAIDESYKNLSYYIKGSVKVTGFRSGSIIADYTINTTKNNSVDFTSENTQVSEILWKAGIPVKDFEESEEFNMTTKQKFYPQQSMELRCSHLKSVHGKMKWRVNDKDPAENKAKYNITNDGSGSTLIVKDVSESDRGRYSCVIETSTTPYVRWQEIFIEPRPDIVVDKTEIKLPCTDKTVTVTLTCCVYPINVYPIEWAGSPSYDGTNSEPGCITVQHKINSTSCESIETFICKLKNLKELKDYDYYKKRIQVQTVRDFDCKKESLGVGKVGDIVKGLCERGMKGYITYQCKKANSKNVWIPTQRECVVESIKDLERKAKALIVLEIPGFMESLSQTAEQNNVEITQSAPTVQTVVEILSTVANISQDSKINKPVVKDFLKTVDLIVADESKNTWAELNNGENTGNKSTELLQTIENISDHLSEGNFTITETSIQLIRTTVENSFTGTSQLLNSTTQIVIPNVVKPTHIAITVFKKLDNVLPTRSTTINDNKTSENRINGDVVVVKISETINNILLTFDIKNTSLKNPQCVFWNSSLDRWDSTGCKVKISGNEADKVTCECTHTTSFSILMSPVANEDPGKQRHLAYITYIGVGISIACLIFCLFIEMAGSNSERNYSSHMRHVSIVNIAVSLLIANICFIIGAAIADEEQMISVDPCSAVVFFMHFFYLALFFWMLVLTLFRILSQQSETKMTIIAITVGYGAPLLIAVITVASTAGPKNYVSKENACWLNWTESKALLAFVIPALTILAINLLVVCKLLRAEGGARGQDERYVIVVIVSFVAILTPIFCLTWGFGIGTMVSRDFGVHVVFAALNSLQGFLVLVFGKLLSDKCIRQHGEGIRRGSFEFGRIDVDNEDRR
ncbi:hypothetical protein IRJ41_010535 [Triplophysa rosa]|uniref:Adhesion G protein-coupled receptor F5 n=1 Tax=Triplophysa rosa TaxID=992332 RepID=A0A9W7WJM3_TRIRA|nr:hypothetical protein IRJ41_010535 [Triplophysa rosa]